jgi:hypothetical protein
LVEVPLDRSFYQTRLDLLDSLGVVLDIHAALDLERGEVTWEFFSLDPETGGFPFNPFLGFLPPNTNGIIGQGFVTYTIRPKPGIAQGGIINAEARIFFDSNEPMDTPRIFNTVDASQPTSTVRPLPASTNRNVFSGQWVGTDASGGSGIGGFDVYVSVDDGPWRLWLANTPYWEQLFVGECGHTYAFYSVARDNVGHVEAALPAVQAQIFVLPNSPPLLEPLNDRVVAVGERRSITNVATDLDAPAQGLSFSLEAAPAGMTIGAASGVRQWQPLCVQGHSVNWVTVRVTDDGCGFLKSTQRFAVTVTDCLQTALGRTVAAMDSNGCLAVHLESSDNLTNLTVTIQVPPGRFTNFTATPSAPEVCSARVVSQDATQAVLVLTACPGQMLRGPKQVADLCFRLVAPQASAFLPLEVVNILGQRENGTPVGNTAGRAGRAVAVGEEPLLEASRDASGQTLLSLYALPGSPNILEYTEHLSEAPSWTFERQVVMTNLSHVIPPGCTNNCSLFFRAQRR